MIAISKKSKETCVITEKAVKTVYCLYRVSTKNQVIENDIPMQKTACHDFALQQPGWYIKREFLELGVSGYKLSLEDRDQLQELKACAERKEFDVLLVFMFDRLGRREDETPFVLRWFTQNGIEVWSVKEGQQTFNTSADILINFIRFWTASTESEKTSERVKTRLRQMVEQGRYTGENIPFGYRLVPSGESSRTGKSLMKPEIIPEEVDIVKTIFNKTTVEGMASTVLANLLNEMGIRTHKGAVFRSSTINRILRNPMYCGFYYRGEVLSPRQNDLQIIDDDVYNEAQRILDSRSIKKSGDRNYPSRSKGSSLLSGNIFCGYCTEKELTLIKDKVLEYIGMFITEKPKIKAPS